MLNIAADKCVVQLCHLVSVTCLTRTYPQVFPPSGTLICAKPRLREAPVVFFFVLDNYVIRATKTATKLAETATNFVFFCFVFCRYSTDKVKGTVCVL